MALELTQTDFAGRPAARLTSNRLSLTVLPAPGGRIISLQLDGTELMYQDPQLIAGSPNVGDAPDVPSLKRERSWQHYGGDKTWLAPQDRWTDELPFLDLDSGTYELEEARGDNTIAVRLTSPICRESGIQVSRTIFLDEAERIRIRLEMTNHTASTVSWGLWDVTQLGGPGRLVMPVRPAPKGLDDVNVYANETRAGREALGRFARRDANTVIVDCHQAEQFKFGTDSREGWLLALLDRGDRTIAFFRSIDTYGGAAYPHPSTSEVFDSETLLYFEMETHGPLIELDPGASYGRAETWSFESFDPARSISDYVRERKGLRKGN